MSTSLAVPAAMEEFLDEGLVTEVLSVIKSGKEAAAYLCRGSRTLGHRYAVAKVYHDRTRRNFANDSVYAGGNSLMQAVANPATVVGRAIAAKGKAGRAISGALWVDHEFETLFTLRDAGLDVPDVFAATEGAILMEYLGTGPDPAPQLRHVQLEPSAAARTWERLRWNVEEMLRLNVVHGDLSPYNVLYLEGRALIIDFPQAVDPRFSEHARDLLERDLRNLTTFFSRWGVTADPGRIAMDWWSRWERGRL